MNFDWKEFRSMLTNHVFATWFGWSIILAIIVFPVTATISSCWDASVTEDIEIAKLQAKHGSQEIARTETMKWMVSRGVHPLVARCAIFNDPWQTCASLISDLEEEERSTIEEMLAHPFVEVSLKDSAAVGLIAPTQDYRGFVEGLDFGSRVAEDDY